MGDLQDKSACTSHLTKVDAFSRFSLRAQNVGKIRHSAASMTPAANRTSSNSNVVSALSSARRLSFVETRPAPS
jgi:hypothetical protein